MKMGDNVISKKTGLPAYGTIVAILKPNIWYFYNPETAQRCLEEWVKLYPDVYEKDVVVVQLSSPQKNVRFDEFVKSFDTWEEEQRPNEEEMKILYKYNVRLTENAVYPIDDLELVDINAELN